ncbi:hypothetical protein MKEN_00017400 [Mycena kentingensis (nom. inval.)]|nr:hypothetical protein MKEN_00017400 [Mycena kentingensis (nom. inval.)]
MSRTSSCAPDECAQSRSPIHRLPPELLTLIFEREAATSPGDSEIEEVVRSRLLRLASVSRHWRAVALDTPGLWSKITVNTARWPERPILPDKLLGYTQTALARSKNHALNIQLVANSNDATSAAVIALLVQHAPRWRHLQLRIHKDQLNLLEPIRGCMPLLETLVLHTRARRIHMFAAAPRLKSVTFWGPSDCDLSLPWDNIDLFQSSGGQMQATTSLSFMSFLPPGSASYFYINAAGMPPESIVLPHIISRVHRFGVDVGSCMHHKHTLRRLWESVTFTDLRHLYVKPRPKHSTPIWDSASFHALSLRSRFCESLVSLALRVAIIEPELVDVLSSLPALEELGLTDLIWAEPPMAVITNSLLRKLTWDSSSSRCIILPRLQKLYLRTLLAFSDAVLLNAVRSRVPLDLKQLSLCYAAESARDLGHALLEEMAELENATFAHDETILEI